MMVKNSPSPTAAITPTGSGWTRVIAATAIGGAAGYLITWLVPRFIGFGDYAEFAAFWGLLFFFVSALSGIQQEVTRASRPASLPAGTKGNALRFGIAASVIVVIGLLLTAIFWGRAVFVQEGWSLVWPTVVGAASYIFVAVVGGILYGLQQWNAVFWLVTLEATLRLVAIGTVLAFTTDVVALAWAVALPFPVTLVMLFHYLAMRVRGKAELDVGLADLSWNVVRTVVAAASMGLLISGMPALLRLVGRDESDAYLGLIIITMTLTRAPLIVVAMALQSYFIVQFKAAGPRFWSVFLRLCGIVLGAGAILTVAGFLAGPPVFSWLFPDETVPDAGLIAAMILSSAIVGLLCVSAPAVLARSQHFVYGSGWLTAAIATLVVLVLPIPFTDRVLAALFLGPVAGLLVYWSYLAGAMRADAKGRR